MKTAPHLALVVFLGATAACSGSAARPDGGPSPSIGGQPVRDAGTATGGTSAARDTSGPTDGKPGTPPSSTPADCRREGDGKTTLVFVNRCAKDISFRGSDIPGGHLAPGAFACVDVGTDTQPISSKRYWGYGGSDPGAEHHSLAEFTFNSDFHNLDWYNISYVDAFNLPLAIVPNARPNCRTLSCPQDFLSLCPASAQLRDTTGDIVACVSPDRDNPNAPVPLLFEQCDDAYAWSGDDQKGTDKSPMVGCQVEDFDIVFCPEPS